MSHTTDLTDLARLHLGLLEVASIVQSAEDLPQLLDAVAETLSRSLGWRTVVVNLYRPAWNDLEVVAVHGPQDVRSALLGGTTGWETWAPLMGERFERRGAYLVPHGEFDWTGNDTASWVPEFVPEPDADAWHPEDALFAAMRDATGTVLGILSVDEPRSGRRPSDAQLDALVAVAAHAGLAVRHALDIALARRHRLAIEHFLDIFSRYRASASPEDVVRAVRDGIRDTLGFEWVEVELFEAGDPAPLSAVLAPRHERHGGFLMTAAEAAALAPGLGSRPPSERSGRGPHAWCDHRLFLPLIASTGTLLGIVSVGEPADRLLPGTEELRMLRVFADQAALTLESGGQWRELRYLADHDPLTGLGNRRAFVATLESETARADRYGTRFTLVVCDVDGLKALNDRSGHAAGDDALRRLGEVLAAELRRSDGAYRIGGDEFALVLIGDDEGGHARDVTRRIDAALATPAEGAPPLSVSFGAVAAHAGEAGEALLRRADAAMYERKRARGADRVE